MAVADEPYARVANALSGTYFSRIEHVARTGSTNADAAERLGDAASAGLTIVADYQSDGAGRRGRSWQARAGSALLFTTILPEAVAASKLWIVPYWTALAVRLALADAGIDAALQWPNDLLAGERKIAGILCTSRVTGEMAHVACGVGINVHRSEANASEIVPAPAYCSDFNASLDRASLLLAILRHYDASLELIADTAEVARRYEAAAGLPGKRYRILKDGALTSFDCVALRLAEGGGLVVRRDDGTVETIALADARVLR